MHPSLACRRQPPLLARALRARLALSSQDGITTIEFAFITPIVLLLITGIIEFSLIMFSMSAMESATASTARLGKTGYIPEGMSRQDAIIQNIENRTAGLLEPSQIVITYTIYPAFDDVEDEEPYTDTNGNGVWNTGEPYTDINGNGQWDEDMGESGLGSAGDIVVYNVSYPWPVTTPIINLIVGSIFNITVRTVVKNEPFDV